MDINTDLLRQLALRAAGFLDLCAALIGKDTGGEIERLMAVFLHLGDGEIRIHVGLAGCAENIMADAGLDGGGEAHRAGLGVADQVEADKITFGVGFCQRADDVHFRVGGGIIIRILGIAGGGNDGAIPQSDDRAEGVVALLGGDRRLPDCEAYKGCLKRWLYAHRPRIL
jgi:hypothetical protein